MALKSERHIPVIDYKAPDKGLLIRTNAGCPQVALHFQSRQRCHWDNLLTKFHEDWNINVASTGKMPCPLVVKTNLLTKFHEDWTINANLDCAQRTNHKT
ncbi:hypothetical protein DPMN_171505 [Dreissena polymorpha]|uniref:Uncharacterized protein n=1 Tax=Dreissena polymorpha TaxID=45954 RepID=A0A9D4DZ20_DREPO|nr:hypothetical protein DPMN_171505 [Dreissena polymorpha]